MPTNHKKTKGERRVQSLIFQDWGTFFGTIMVAVGYKDYSEIKSHLLKEKYNDWHKAMEDKPDEFNTNHFSKWQSNDVTYQLLFLKDWVDDMEHYKILAHELIHAVQFCLSDFIDNEREFETVAYQHSYLFSSIANELNSINKLPNNKNK